MCAVESEHVQYKCAVELSMRSRSVAESEHVQVEHDKTRKKQRCTDRNGQETSEMHPKTFGDAPLEPAWVMVGWRGKRN